MFMERFINWNKRHSEWIESKLPKSFTVSFNRLYEQTASELMNQTLAKIVLDVGGGKKCFIANFRDPAIGTKIYAADILEEDLRVNADADGKMVVDATQTLPFADNSIDLITSRSVMEHLVDTGAFMREAHRILKPGGYFINLCPGKFAPFAVINQLLPPKLAHAALDFFHPSFSDDCGFKAYYNKTYHRGVEKNLSIAGFSFIEIKNRYYQSIYFNFFTPIYLISLTYDLINKFIGIKSLSSQLLIIAKK